MLKMRTISILFAASVLFSGTVWSQWNLPYQRPAKYDYSSYYADDLADFIKSRPADLPNEMKKAWSFFKSNFILSNGLVNHSRWDNEQQRVVGTNEAVSEGQGYGMLLSVLMNDQATFNKVFNAANQQLWSGSSYKWEWNGGNGSATDADLDIGLALVFADALVKAGMWNNSSGGVSYSARALEIIKSIKNTMTSGNYLLPGDSWGGGAEDKQNTSYFSLAALKIFDDYQSEVNFKSVVDNCYQVLQAAPRYNVGQTPNWMTRNGGRTSPGNVSDGNVYGMGNDAIRTPWRIAMDAMWYDDARAKTYCANIKKTLTLYDSDDWAGYLTQMGFYGEDGKVIASTGGYPETTAMWACGILGSKDNNFTTNGLRRAIITRIAGTPSDYFGDAALKDHYFYFKQAVSLLGFAFVTGQFPNVWADYKADLIKPREAGIQLVEPFKVSSLRIYFPEKVIYTAKLSESSDWTITLTGLASNITKTFNGEGTDITVEWDGTDFTQQEMVEASLSGSKIDNSDPDALIVKAQIMTPWDDSMPVNHPLFSSSKNLLQVSNIGNVLRLDANLAFGKPAQVSLSNFNGQKVFQSNRLHKAGHNTWHLNLDNSLQNGLYVLSAELQDEKGRSYKSRSTLLINR